MARSIALTELWWRGSGPSGPMLGAKAPPSSTPGRGCRAFPRRSHAAAPARGTHAAASSDLARTPGPRFRAAPSSRPAASAEPTTRATSTCTRRRKCATSYSAPSSQAAKASRTSSMERTFHRRTACTSPSGRARTWSSLGAPWAGASGRTAGAWRPATPCRMPGRRSVIRAWTRCTRWGAALVGARRWFRRTTSWWASMARSTALSG
mmetsp:Transcript_105695/g.252102  ORF Transcript_105695/g.252102 Transcript_105695/m.252102 type:complete len:208 (+) Transcript_105695:6171-6794(+)